MKIDTLERERDFYFDKLREIEILCQNRDVASTPVSYQPSAMMCCLPFVTRLLLNPLNLYLQVIDSQTILERCDCFSIFWDVLHKSSRKSRTFNNCIWSFAQQTRPETFGFLQIIKFIERILYATDEREAKEAMLEAQNLYADVTS